MKCAFGIFFLIAVLPLQSFGASITGDDFVDDPEAEIEVQMPELEPHAVLPAQRPDEGRHVFKGHGRDVIITKTSTHVFEHGDGKGDARNNIGKINQ